MLVNKQPQLTPSTFYTSSLFTFEGRLDLLTVPIKSVHDSIISYSHDIFPTPETLDLRLGQTLLISTHWYPFSELEGQNQGCYVGGSQ